MDEVALSYDEMDQLIGWQTVALDVDALSAASHVAVVVEADVLRTRTGA